MKRRTLTYAEIMSIIGSVENWAYDCPFKRNLIDKLEKRMTDNTRNAIQSKGEEDGK